MNTKLYNALIAGGIGALAFAGADMRSYLQTPKDPATANRFPYEWHQLGFMLLYGFITGFSGAMGIQAAQ